jgi:integrase
MWSDTRGMPGHQLLRTALSVWAFNTTKRRGELPPDIAVALRWAERHSRPVSALADPEVLRAVLDGLTTRLDGQPYAPSVISRRRKILNAAVEYAVELKLLDANPIPALKWAPPRPVQAVDRRRVANPVQVRTLLRAVGEQRPSGPRLVAFFGCLYFAGMRPEEAVSLRLRHLYLPQEGWGMLYLDQAEPYAGKDWTDSGTNRDSRQLKQRQRGEVRAVPCPPELTTLLRRHLTDIGTAVGGRLFVGERNAAELPKRTILQVWQRARAAVFTPEVAASPLAETPYDLRHAAVSTWLNGGVPATDVAEWAGHSVEILHRIYAKCLDGGEAVLRQRVQAALGHAAPG